MAIARAAVAIFLLPPAASVPEGISVAAWLPDATVATLVRLIEDLARALWAVAGGTAFELDALRSLSRRILSFLPIWLPDAALLVPRDPLIDPAPHDAYFLLARSAEAPEIGYLRAVLASLDLFLHEARDAQELAAYVQIALALSDIGLAALDAPSLRSRPDDPDARTAVPMGQRAADPFGRWLRGHQVFAVLTQGLVWTLHSLTDATRRADVDAIRTAMVRATSLYRASADAFRFTADFKPSHYADLIRPSMCEPYAPAGFSGGLSVDHAYLVRLLSGMRPVLDVASRNWPALSAAMQRALNHVYADHRWVCERFDGSVQPSLRTDSHHGSTPASEMLERFRKRRLEMLP